MNAGGVIAIAAREVGATWKTPTGWVISALYTLLTASVFTLTTLAPGQPASLRYYFAPAASLLLLVAPALSMRLFSEEFRTGTAEPLRAAPVSDGQVVTGKLLGALACLVLMVAPTLAFPLTLFALGDPAPDPGPMAAGLLGLLLVGLVYVSLGGFVSSLTDSQTLAFLGALLTLLAIEAIAGLLPDRVPAPWDRIAASVSVRGRLGEFSRGVIDAGVTIVLLTTSAWLGVLTWISLSLRRSR
ncbi:MAG: ABC transporter permease [Planctomycetota bacterium]